MGTSAGTHAYGLCLAVLGEPAVAEATALEALRRGGGRSVVAALAHARHEALTVAARNDPADPGRDHDLDEVPLPELARRLALTRAPIERAVVDLHGRHGLDRAQLGRVLGLRPAAAAARATDIERRWTAELDPALVAFLGPAECPRLAELLVDAALYTWLETPPPVSPDAPAPAPTPGQADRGAGTAPLDPAGPLLDRPALLDSPAVAAGQFGTGPVAVATITGPQPVLANPAPAVERRGRFTLAELLHVAGDVHRHTSACEICGDRIRTMVSVRELLARTPLEPAPVPVQAAAGASALLPRFRRPSPWPPSLEGHTGRWRRPAALAAAVIILAGAAAGGVALARRSPHRGQPNAVDALTKVPAVDALAIDGTDALSAGEIFTLANVSTHPLRWTASSQFPWLAVTPARGALGPGDRIDLSTSLADGAPNQATTDMVTITGDDGSATAVDVRVSGEPLPQIDATISGCTVSATVQSPSALAAVTLSWHPHGPASTATMSNRATVNMTLQAGVYVADLPPPAGPVDWWVTASDQAGNGSRSPTHEFALGACPPTG